MRVMATRDERISCHYEDVSASYLCTINLVMETLNDQDLPCSTYPGLCTFLGQEPDHLYL